MLITLLILALIFLTYNYNKYYIATRDSSIEGFVEYKKEKYYYKH